MRGCKEKKKYEFGLLLVLKKISDRNLTFDLCFVSDEEELQLQNQIFDFVKTLQVINLTESELALFSATLLVRPGKSCCNYPEEV